MRDNCEQNKKKERKKRNKIVTMLQNPEEVIQERFLKAVESLKLRFPGKEIEEKTGYKSGIISEYLNSKKYVSAKFLRIFCEKFGLNYNLIANPGFPKAEDPILYDRALIKVLLNEVAKLKARATGSPLEEVLEELEQNTKIELNNLMKGQ